MALDVVLLHQHEICSSEPEPAEAYNTTRDVRCCTAKRARHEKTSRGRGRLCRILLPSGFERTIKLSGRGAEEEGGGESSALTFNLMCCGNHWRSGGCALRPHDSHSDITSHSSRSGPYVNAQLLQSDESNTLGMLPTKSLSLRRRSKNKPVFKAQPVNGTKYLTRGGVTVLPKIRLQSKMGNHCTQSARLDDDVSSPSALSPTRDTRHQPVAPPSTVALTPRSPSIAAAAASSIAQPQLDSRAHSAPVGLARRRVIKQMKNVKTIQRSATTYFFFDGMDPVSAQWVTAWNRDKPRSPTPPPPRYLRPYAVPQSAEECVAVLRETLPRDCDVINNTAVLELIATFLTVSFEEESVSRNRSKTCGGGSRSLVCTANETRKGFLWSFRSKEPTSSSRRKKTERLASSEWARSEWCSPVGSAMTM